MPDPGHAPAPPAGDGKPVPFASTVADLKERVVQLAEDRQMGADLLFTTTYMASLALAEASRPEIFSFAAGRNEYISSKYITKVETYVKKWNYSYAEALGIVSGRVKNPLLKSLLGRYANAIDSGVPDDEYLNNELSTVRTLYRSQIEQGLEMLKKWGDAYIAMLLSSTVIAVTIMISIAIYAPDDIQATFVMSYALIILICLSGNILMYTSVPFDPKSHGLRAHASKEQLTIRAMERVIVPVAIACVVALVLLGASAGIIFLVVGLLAAPLGIIGFIDDANITRRDTDFSTFIRSLGAVMGGKGTTAVHALATIDRKSLTALEPLVSSVYSRLNLGLDDRQVWERFIGESGSNLVSKYLNIYLDTVTLGGPPDAIGNVVGSSMLEQTLLREKKDMHARSFIVLLLPMHLAMAGIFVVLYRIMVVLTGSVAVMLEKFGEAPAAAGSAAGGISASGALGGMTMFTSFPELEMGVYVVISLTFITLSNIAAARIVGGGDRYMFYFYTALFCALTGIVLLVSPVVVNIFFSPGALTQAGGPAAMAALGMYLV
jgi:flagellar protein FlaJ